MLHCGHQYHGAGLGGRGQVGEDLTLGADIDALGARVPALLGRAGDFPGAAG